MSFELVDSPHGIFAAKVTGTLQAFEYHQLLKQAAEFILKHGKTRILITAEGFTGFASAGEWGDTAFQEQFDRQIEKIAIIGEKKFEDLVLMFTGKGLRKV